MRVRVPRKTKKVLWAVSWALARWTPATTRRYYRFTRWELRRCLAEMES